MTIIYDHALAFYQALESDSKEEELENVPLKIYRGSITRVYRSLGISQAYYSQVRKALVESGCIAILRQGARNTDSVIVLHHPPDEHEFEVTQDRLTPNLSLATLTQRVADLTRLVGGISIGEALANHEKRIRQLEREVEKIGAQKAEAGRRARQ